MLIYVCCDNNHKVCNLKLNHKYIRIKRILFIKYMFLLRMAALRLARFLEHNMWPAT